MSTTGKKLKNLRQQKNLTLSELGEKIGSKHAYLSNIERGKQNISDEKLQEILTLGFGFDPPEARKTVDKWRIEERLAKGNITISELNILGNNSINSITGEKAHVEIGKKENNETSNIELLKLIKELKDDGIPIEKIFELLKK